MKNNAFFPLFVDISEKKIVVIGGGAIATRRVKTLLSFEPQIVVVAPEVTGELEELEKEEKITIFHRKYQREDIYDAWMVLAATNDPELNNGIYSVAKCLGALVNVASNQGKCDFHFPGVIRKDPYVIGINGSGKDHKGTAELRKQIEAMVNNAICIGSRESRLAVIQSEMVMEYLKKECPQKEIRLLTMKTTGDKILDRTLDKVGGKGLFVKELDKALMEKRSDLSVHSLKICRWKFRKNADRGIFKKGRSERRAGASGRCRQPGSVETDRMFQSETNPATAADVPGSDL